MTQESGSQVRVGGPSTSSVLFFGASLFILGLAVGIIGWGQGSRLDLTSLAKAQPMRATSAGGIMAFTGQIEKDIYGIMMVDVDAGTLWVYQYRKNGNQLKLLAARNWLYDRYLEEYNSGSPSPSEVAQLVASQQQKAPNATATAPAPAE